MTLITRSAMIQARVMPWVKRESRKVLQDMGLTMSEAMELFLRRLIEDRKMPFSIEALDYDPEIFAEEGSGSGATGAQSKAGRGGSPEKNSKFL